MIKDVGDHVEYIASPPYLLFHREEAALQYISKSNLYQIILLNIIKPSRLVD